MKTEDKLKDAILEYVKFTRNHTREGMSREHNLDHAVLGIMSEIGEIADALKKHIAYDLDLDEENILEELGDFMWFKCLYLRTLENPDEEICCKIYDAIHSESISNDSKFLSEMSNNKFDVIIVLLESMFFSHFKDWESCSSIKSVAFIADCISEDLDFEDAFIGVLNRNMDKLNKRYGEKWDRERGIERPDKQ